MTNQTLTPQETATLLGVSYYTVMGYIKDGLLPATCDLDAPPVHRRYAIRRDDALALRSLRETFRPGPKPGNSDRRTMMYLPRSAEWGAWVKRALTGEERARVLENFARLKEADEVGFEVELGMMQEGYQEVSLK